MEMAFVGRIPEEKILHPDTAMRAVLYHGNCCQVQSIRPREADRALRRCYITRVGSKPGTLPDIAMSHIVAVHRRDPRSRVFSVDLPRSWHRYEDSAMPFTLGKLHTGNTPAVSVICWKLSDIFRHGLTILVVYRRLHSTTLSQYPTFWFYMSYLSSYQPVRSRSCHARWPFVSPAPFSVWTFLLRWHTIISTPIDLESDEIHQRDFHAPRGVFLITYN